MIGSQAAISDALQRSVGHIKEPQNSIYCLNFLKMTKFERLDCFIKSKVECPVSQDVVSVLSVQRCIFHCVRT